MSERSIYGKIFDALDLAVAAEVGVTFTWHQALELRGYIKSLEEAYALERVDSNARIAELEENNKKLRMELHTLRFKESQEQRFIWWIREVYAKRVKDAIQEIKEACITWNGTCSYKLPAKCWEDLGRIMESTNGIYDGTYLDVEISTGVKSQKSLGDEVMEIIQAALSGDCQKYLNYDLQGNKYCKWGIVEKDIRALFETSSDNNKCMWVIVEDPEIDLWCTSCGEEFHIEADTPSDNHMKYCCYCGKEIAEG